MHFNIIGRQHLSYLADKLLVSGGGKNCSDEKYLEFQTDGNLPYTCPTCRGECHQVCLWGITCPFAQSMFSFDVSILVLLSSSVVGRLGILKMLFRSCGREEMKLIKI